VRRRIELRSELVGREVVVGRLETVLGMAKGVPLPGETFDVCIGFCRLEFRRAEAMPDRDVRCDHVRQIDVLRPFQGLVIDPPKALALLRRSRFDRSQQQAKQQGKLRHVCAHHFHSRSILLAPRRIRPKMA
jgi:hypothetical protein